MLWPSRPRPLEAAAYQGESAAYQGESSQYPLKKICFIYYHSCYICTVTFHTVYFYLYGSFLWHNYPHSVLCITEHPIITLHKLFLFNTIHVTLHTLFSSLDLYIECNCQALYELLYRNTVSELLLALLMTNANDSEWFGLSLVMMRC